MTDTAPDSVAALVDAKAEIERLRCELSDCRNRLLTAAGDDLCRLTQEEINAYTSGEVPIPPKEEFIPSCERFWEQMAAKAGVNHNCLTLAQLVAENERLRTALEYYANHAHWHAVDSWHFEVVLTDESDDDGWTVAENALKLVERTPAAIRRG